MTGAVDTSAAATGRRVVVAAATYFAVVFAVGLLLGPVRVLWIEPWLGATLAILCEAPLLVLAMVFGARVAPAMAGLRGGWPTRLVIGVLALVMQQLADLSVGFGLRGVTLREQLGYFQTLPGYIYAAMLVMFALMPLIVYLRAAPTKNAD